MLNSRYSNKYNFLIIIKIMKVILTGSNGQLGNSIRSIIPKNINLISLSRKELDLSDKEACEKKILEIKPDWVINSGAYTNVDDAEDNVDLSLKINRDAPKYIALGLSQTGGKLIQISTDYVFNGRSKIPYKINDQRDPISVYGLSKSKGEEAIENIMGESGKFVIIRTSWLMGPFGKNFLKTILNLHQNRTSINVVCDQIGCPTNSLSLANLCWKIVKEFSFSNKNIKLPQILHWSDNGITSWDEVAKFVGDYSFENFYINQKAKIVPILANELNAKAKRPIYSLLDCSYTENLLGIQQIEWRNSIASIIRTIYSKN
tara:strand:+ start:9272 stop:10225 length:954 start_codon:yes stop_codon:yes gene_type:complete